MAINTITASGNLGGDCELRWTNAQKPIASFSLPVKQGYGEHEKTSWVTCKMFGVKAEKLTEYLKKGMKVTVSGEFVIEEWTGNDGAKHQKPVIIVSQIDFGSSSSTQQIKQPQSINEPPPNFGDDPIPF